MINNGLQLHIVCFKFEGGVVSYKRMEFWFMYMNLRNIDDSLDTLANLTALLSPPSHETNCFFGLIEFGS